MRRGGAGPAADAAPTEGEHPRRRNILLVMADQFVAHALERAGNEHFSTPNLDRLAAAGTRFTRAYTTFPLCVPARSSMLTGRMPHELGIVGNSPSELGGGESRLEPGARPGSLGRVLGAAGYECFFAGKWHATRPDAHSEDAFTVVHPFGDAGLAESCADWIRDRDAADPPFLFIASFDDPHTICEYARNQPLPYGNVPEVDIRDAPPLPHNYGSAPYEPEALRHEQRVAAASNGTQAYGPDDWRRYRDAYARLVERADRNIGVVLDALDASALREETVVIFTSDHGDGDAAHSWNQKTALYEECARVPLLARWPGAVGAVDDRLISVGLDLLPTLCSIAEAPVPPGLDGHSFIPRNLPAEDLPPSPAHDHVVVETEFSRAGRPRTRGRSIVAGRYKYSVYNWGKWREQLHDLALDPGELRNLAVESAFDTVLDDMRGQLMQWCLRTRDTDFAKVLVLPRNTDPDVRERIFEVPY